MARAQDIKVEVVDEEKGHAKAKVDEKLDEACTTMVKAKTWFDKITFGFEMFQVLLLVLALVFGWWCCTLMSEAASTAQEWQPRPNDFNTTRSCNEGDVTCFQAFDKECSRCRSENWPSTENGRRRIWQNRGTADCEDTYCSYGIHPRGGDLIGRNGGACQVHFRVGEALGLAKGANVTVAQKEIDTGAQSSGTVAKVDFGAMLGAKINKVLFGGDKDAVTIGCPIDLGDDADCSLTDADWEVFLYPDSGETFEDSIDFYTVVARLMPIWFIVKLLSLNGDIIDTVIRKLTCGMVRDNEGRLDDLMIDFDFLQRCPALQFICKYVVKYLRFKLAANVLLWPLTTIGFNSKCPDHVYTKMPHIMVWRVAMGTVIADGAYLLVYYFAVSCCKKIKTYRVFYLPFIATTALSIVCQVYAFAFTGSALFVFGWNFSLVFKFTMSISFNVFSLIFSILSVVEQVSLFVMIGKFLRKQDPETRRDQAKRGAEKAIDNANAVAATTRDAGVTVPNLLQSEVICSKEHSNGADDA